MKNKGNTKEIEYWLALSERYFDALTTSEEEKALAQFLASDAADDPAFNEIKAVMGYLSTGKSIAQKKVKQKWFTGKIVHWSVAVASIALITIIGTRLLPHPTMTDANESNEIFYACIDGKEYTDEEFVMQHMLATMNMMSTASDNVIEEQMKAMFRINK
jgi:hypothetical protein